MSGDSTKTPEDYRQEIRRLKKINEALITRVERSTDQQGKYSAIE